MIKKSYVKMIEWLSLNRHSKTIRMSYSVKPEKWRNVNCPLKVDIDSLMGHKN